MVVINARRVWQAPADTPWAYRDGIGMCTEGLQQKLSIKSAANNEPAIGMAMKACHKRGSSESGKHVVIKSGQSAV